MKIPTFSIIIPTRRNPATLWLTLQTTLATVPPETEILVIPDLIDGKPDPATLGMLGGYADRNGGVPVITLPTAGIGFPGCANTGLAAARGKYLVVLHDDTTPTAGWLDGLRASLLAAQSAIPDVRWGYAGPMTNYGMIRQLVSSSLSAASDPKQREAVAEKLRTSAMDEFTPSGPLDSFCLMITRQAYEKVGGFDERFAPGGHEDVDLILRGQEAGFHALRAPRVFIFHAGRTTLREVTTTPYGDTPNQEVLMDKWYPPLNSPTEPYRKLCFLVTVRLMTEGQQARFVEQMRHLTFLGDEAVVLDDRSVYPAMEPLKNAGLRDFVTEYRKNPGHLPPNTKRDRNLLLQMGRESDADWLMGIDQDTWFDPKVTRGSLQELMWPVDPTIRAYQYPIRVNWHDLQTLRVDEQWGQMQGASLFRNLDWGGMLELTHAPEDTLPTCLPPEQVSPTARLVLYDRRYLDLEEARAGGLTFNEMPVLTIPDYSPKLTYLLFVKNEMTEMARQACQFKHWADRMVVVDNGSIDGLQAFCERYGLAYTPFLCCDEATNPEHMVCDFGAARNFAVDQCPDDSYILALDGDEELSLNSYVLIPHLIRERAAGFLCDINNHQLHPTTNQLQVYQTLQARLFVKHPLLRYEPEVHESLEYAFKRHKDQLKLVKSDVVIEHHGYTREKPTERKWKGEHYAQKLAKIIERDPTDARSVYALGQHLCSLKHYDDGDHLLGKALSIDPEFFTCRVELGLRLMRRSFDIFATTPMRSVPTEEKKALIQKILQTLNPWVGDMT